MQKHHRRLSLAADISLAMAIIIFFFVGLTIGFKFAPDPIKEIIYKMPGEDVVQLSIPAVNDQGQGVMTKLTAKLKSGYGQVLVNVNDVISGYELQMSARDAVHVVSNMTGISMDSYDVTFSIDADAAIVDGRSASAAMAVSVLALLENKTIGDDVTITGAIGAEGGVEPVSRIEAKALAAKKNGYRLILVPRGQGKEIEQEEKIVCSSEEMEYCKVDYQPKVSLINFGGISIKETIDIREALKWLEQGSLEKYSSELKEEDEEKQPSKPVDLNELGISDFSSEDYDIVNVEVSGSLMALQKDCLAIPMSSSQDQIESLIQGIEQNIVDRPNSHDIMKTTMGIYEISVIAVLIDRFEQGVFYSRLILRQDNKIVSLDSKPSDALAIASRFNSPVYVKKEILEAQGQRIC